ncbi:hypothetical protein J6590_107472, partial [Homalodisca vitripennis]
GVVKERNPIRPKIFRSNVRCPQDLPVPHHLPHSVQSQRRAAQIKMFVYCELFGVADDLIAEVMARQDPAERSGFQPPRRRPFAPKSVNIRAQYGSKL